MRVALIACTKSKTLKSYIKAKELYWASNLFRLSYTYAKEVWKADKIYILSAKYGLIHENYPVSYYEQTLKHLSKDEGVRWGSEIFEQLKKMRAKFLVLASQDYRRLIDFSKLNAEMPCIKMRLGPKLVWLKQEIQRHRFPGLRNYG